MTDQWQINAYCESTPQDMLDYTIWMLKIARVNARFKVFRQWLAHLVAQKCIVKTVQ